MPTFFNNIYQTYWFFFFIFVQSVPSIQQQQELMNEAIEKAKRAAELQAKIQAQLANKPNLVRTVLFKCICTIFFYRWQACTAREATHICWAFAPAQRPIKWWQLISCVEITKGICNPSENSRGKGFKFRQDMHTAAGLEKRAIQLSGIRRFSFWATNFSFSLAWQASAWASHLATKQKKLN